MKTYQEAEKIIIDATFPDGKVYCSGDAGDFFYFIIVPKGFPNISNAIFGATYFAVDKKDGHVWDCPVTDPRLKKAKKIVSP